MVMYMKTKQIGAGEFKTHCLQLLDEIHAKHISLVITKRGKPLAKLIPFAEKATSLYGCLKGAISMNGDIVQSTGETWEAETDG